MKSRIPALAALAVWAVASLASPVNADIPKKKLKPGGETYIGSDPWVPDSRDPRRVYAPPQQENADRYQPSSPGDPDTPASARAAEDLRYVRSQLWLQRVLRTLNSLLPGGFLR